MTDWLEEIRARAEAATPGPWTQWGLHCQWTDVWTDEESIVLKGRDAYGDDVFDEYAQDVANTVFAAHSRTDIPRLLSRVRALEAQAALDAGVREAYEKLFNVAQRVTELPPPWARPNCKASAMHCWLADVYVSVVDVIKARLDAALAAREGKGEE